MSKLNDDLYLTPVTFTGIFGSMVLNLVVIADPKKGLTLVDTSMPGHIGAIEEALAADGFKIEDIKQIIITHQDVDHIGSLAHVKNASGAKVIAHSIEVPFIEGKQRSVKYPSQERFDQNPGMQEMFEAIARAPVDQVVEDGEVLDLAGGVRVIHTPGHTLGHISLFLERSKILITGDALTSAEGQLRGFGEGATPDHPTAIESVKKLASLSEVNAIVTYHGGLVSDDPLGQLQRVARELSNA